MNTRFPFALIIFLLTTASFSTVSMAANQSHDKSSNKKSVASLAVGLNIGDVLGNGLIFRLYSERSFSQVTYGGYVDKIDDEKYFNLSLSHARYLKKVKPSAYTSSVGLKWVVGGAAIYDSFRGETANKVNIGSGFGIDFGAINEEGFVFSLNAIYTLGFSGLREPAFASLTFEPTVGVLYNFE